MCQIDFFSIPDHMEVSEFTELTVTLFLNCVHSAPVWVVRPVRSGCVAFKRRESGRRAFMYRSGGRDGGSEVRKIGFLEES